MNIPGFSAETSLYKTSRHYRMIGKFGPADGTIYPTLSISDPVRSSLGLADLAVKSKQWNSRWTTDRLRRVTC